ncbi:TPA: hypothetical protein ACH3X1_007377 [Trebouxia sp. C0004]
MPVDGNIATLKLYWKLILSNSSNLELPKLAMLLLDIKPHAADPEKTVSLMGWYHSARRHSLLSATITAMTTVKMHYQTVRTGELLSATLLPVLLFTMLFQLHVFSKLQMRRPRLRQMQSSWQ